MGMVYRQSGRNVWMLKYCRDGVPASLKAAARPTSEQ